MCPMTLSREAERQLQTPGWQVITTMNNQYFTVILYPYNHSAFHFQYSPEKII